MDAILISNYQRMPLYSVALMVPSESSSGSLRPFNLPRSSSVAALDSSASLTAVGVINTNNSVRLDVFAVASKKRSCNRQVPQSWNTSI